MRRIGGKRMHLTRRIPHVSLLSAAILSVSGCVTYHAAPLDPQASQQSFEREAWMTREFDRSPNVPDRLRRRRRGKAIPPGIWTR